MALRLIAERGDERLSLAICWEDTDDPSLYFPVVQAFVMENEEIMLLRANGALLKAIEWAHRNGFTVSFKDSG